MRHAGHLAFFVRAAASLRMYHASPSTPLLICSWETPDGYDAGGGGGGSSSSAWRAFGRAGGKTAPPPRSLSAASPAFFTARVAPPLHPASQSSWLTLDLGRIITTCV